VHNFEDDLFFMKPLRNGRDGLIIYSEWDGVKLPFIFECPIIILIVTIIYKKQYICYVE